MLEHPRLIILLIIPAFSGISLVLSQLRWFSRISLTERMRPYTPGLHQARTRNATFRALVTPVLTSGGARITQLLGMDDDVAARLQRADIDIDAAAFRMHQFAWTGGALLMGLLVTIGLRPPALLSLMVVLGFPVLAFLVVEQRLATAAEARQRRQFNELPVITEQLAMLIGAGYSLGGALSRLADRGAGVVSRDLKRVVDRARHGLSVEQALAEWAAIAKVPEIDRLVAVLSLSAETNDLGRLIAEESRSIRSEAQRRLTETIDKRTEQVWVPVTVATLVPGLVFLAIPFAQALRLFSAN